MTFFEETIELVPEIDTPFIKTKLIMIKHYLTKNCFGDFSIEYEENKYGCIERLTFVFENPKDLMNFKLSYLYERLKTEHAI